MGAGECLRAGLPQGVTGSGARWVRGQDPTTRHVVLTGWAWGTEQAGSGGSSEGYFRKSHGHLVQPCHCTYGETEAQRREGPLVGPSGGQNQPSCDMRTGLTQP